jgi:hypothetical protein
MCRKLSWPMATVRRSGECRVRSASDRTHADVQASQFSALRKRIADRISRTVGYVRCDATGTGTLAAGLSGSTSFRITGSLEPEVRRDTRTSWTRPHCRPERQSKTTRPSRIDMPHTLRAFVSRRCLSWFPPSYLAGELPDNARSDPVPAAPGAKMRQREPGSRCASRVSIYCAPWPCGAGWFAGGVSGVVGAGFGSPGGPGAGVTPGLVAAGGLSMPACWVPPGPPGIRERRPRLQSRRLRR